MSNRRSWLYLATVVGLLGGLVVLLFEPVPTAGANVLLGGALIAGAVASVAALIAGPDGPRRRGPDF